MIETGRRSLLTLLAVVVCATTLVDPRLAVGQLKGKPVSECEEFRQDAECDDIHSLDGDFDLGREFRYSSHAAALDDVECDRQWPLRGLCWSSRAPPV